MTVQTAAARLLRRLLSIVILMAVVNLGFAQSDELQDAQNLLKQGQYDRAIERIDQYLKSKPKDARGRFLRGIVLTEQSKTTDAIRTFTELTQDYPELPEPYNNLAVLQASVGQYERARVALEMAIRTHPSYATAHENLGDIYAKMASQSYDKALQLDKANQAAQTKLNLIRDLFINNIRSPKVAVISSKPITTAPTVAVVTPTPVAPTTTNPAPTNTSKSTTAAPTKDVAKESAKDTAKESTAAKDNARTSNKVTEDALIKTVNNWAHAWSSNDVKGYLAYYAPSFKPPKGASRKDWEKERKARIDKPRKIDVKVDSFKVVLVDQNKAKVSFRQHYQSPPLNSSSTKILTLIQIGGAWLIQEESVGG